MTQAPQELIATQLPHEHRDYETRIVSAGAPIVLSVWPGDASAWF